MLLEDLLETAGGDQRAGATAVRVEGGWPADAALHLQGRVRPRRRAGESGAVVFSAEVDGREIFSRTVRRNKRGAGFSASVPLAGTGGRDGEVVLRIRSQAPELGIGRWQRATIEATEPTPRLAASQGPNLLLVLVDTLRADHCSLYGYRRATTPNLERLAEKSLVFDNAVAQSSWTAPSVASILTGLYPLEHGVIHGEGLRSRFGTVAESLQAAGISTFAVSTNPLIDRDSGYAQGFETFRHLPWQRAPRVNEPFLDWLERARGLRWFAYLHYTDPHSPYDAPPPDGTAFVDRPYDGVFAEPKAVHRIGKEVNFGGRSEQPLTAADLEYLRSVYDGEILYWDRHLGEILDELEDRRLLADTVVIVTSDHGEEFLEHGKLKHRHHLYDESVRVPLLIHAPRRLAAGRRRHPVEIRGIRRAALQLMGVSDLGLRPDDLLSPAEESRPPVFSHTVHRVGYEGGRSALAAVRDGDWKLIRWLREDRIELFDLRRDPRETTNVASSRSERLELYRWLLGQWLDGDSGQAIDGEEPLLDPERLDKLRALGYIP